MEFLSKKIVNPLHLLADTNRRADILSRHLSQLLQHNESLTGLDIGCGSGKIAVNIQRLCPDIRMSGVDVLVRKDTVINVTEFDGMRLPFEDNSYDFTMLIDVLHHTDDPAGIIKECCRVARKFILLKDHFCETWWDRVRLQFMDWVGNRAFDVSLPYNYLSREDWDRLYKASRVVREAEVDKLNLYPHPFSCVFDSTLHFMARLAVRE